MQLSSATSQVNVRSEKAFQGAPKSSLSCCLKGITFNSVSAFVLLLVHFCCVIDVAVFA